MKHRFFSLPFLDKTFGKLRHASLQCLPLQNIYLLFLYGRLSSFDIKASPVYLIGESDRLGLLAFVGNMFSFLEWCSCNCLSPSSCGVIYLLSLFLKVSRVNSSFSCFCSSYFYVIFRGNLDFIIDKSCFCSMFSPSDCNPRRSFSVTSKYVLSENVLFIAIGRFISWA